MLKEHFCELLALTEQNIRPPINSMRLFLDLGAQ